jgi:hypothetical protein
MAKKVATFCEFFAGGGMARAGLAGWMRLFANDFDPCKGAPYRANYGPHELRFVTSTNSRRRISLGGRISFG